MDIHTDLGQVGGMFIFMLLASDGSEPSAIFVAQFQAMLHVCALTNTWNFEVNSFDPYYTHQM